MKNTKRKGFTIVELVIVIAVIAILAAVLIPTFASLINKANRSADIQAVHQMNTALATNEVTAGKDIMQVHSALSEVGISSKDYHPLASNTYFFWDAESNRIVYTDDEYKIIFPEDSDAFDANSSKWFSLSGEIKENKAEGTNGAYTIKNAGELYWLSNHFDDSVTSITISDNINAMGADITFKVTGALTFDGGNKTISNLAQISNLTVQSGNENEGQLIFCGLFSSILSPEDGKVVIKDINIKNSTFGNVETGAVGALVGGIGTDSNGPEPTVSISNCNITSSVINCKNKGGALIGSIGKGTVEISECEINKVTINCSEGDSGKSIGTIWYGATVSVDKAFDEWTKECTINLVSGEWGKRPTKNGEIKFPAYSSYSATDKEKALSGTAIKATVLVETFSGTGKAEGEYRLFSDKSYVNLQAGKINVNNQEVGYLKAWKKNVKLNDVDTVCWPAIIFDYQD